jgi:23S rRNA pseudouridine2605 synthase
MASKVPLNRALSKLGILSRSEATAAILAGRIRVNGRIPRHPTTLVSLAHLDVSIDDTPRPKAEWRAILLHKPRGVVTTRRDPSGRPTVFDAIGSAADGMIAVGRLDLASSGLLLVTTDTALADRITDPDSAVPRVYVVTVRGRVTPEEAASLTRGIGALRAHAVDIRKTSSRESHVTVELREGKNREVRRLFAEVGHEVTRLKRVQLGGLRLGELKPGEWREISYAEMVGAFPQLRCTESAGGAKPR